ncbi:MAG: squalene/phytoene synthase family protein [Rhodobacteraceae bacterium]|jgi:phytoene/squalene synthetase|uniref:squalene/phytoene synthase family protein n=1 Tax=Albidovulum sp. TaxID=1872424 RepID=UPI001DA693D1|nr:squalene/phytoene synthase family protein [uncultured Defluviimonas sp.]MCB2125315.1 squalene/phytoene synthase family protein [Paracoccaceae bacterium]MCC0070521.1 squalene/phytoene synthase family protein [Paracoccaceae bacterium]
MSIEVCARLVEEGDPDRFDATMAAPAEARLRLWPLYAVNLEIARAPWAAREPMLAEMRLQWWIDTIRDLGAGRERRGHPVIEALAPMLAADSNLAELLCGLAEARRWDCLSEPFEDRAHFDAYLDATAGNLMWGAACALGAPQGAEAVVRDLAWGAGLAQWLRAAPELEARGRLPLVDGRPEAIGALAAEGRARIARGRRVRTIVPAPARPALWSAAGADAVLRRAAARATLVAAGGLAPSEFARRGRLLWVALTGRF